MAARRSDASMPREWRIMPGARVWVGGLDVGARRVVEELLAGAVRPPEGPIDAAFICPAAVDEAVYFAGKLRPRIGCRGAIWIVRGYVSEHDVDDHERSPSSLGLAFKAAGLDEFARVPVGDSFVAVGFRWQAV